MKPLLYSQIKQRDGASFLTHFKPFKLATAVAMSSSIFLMSCNTEDLAKEAASIINNQGDKTIHLTIQENENGFCGFDGSLESNNSGYTGTGFVNTKNEVGAKISWSVDVEEAGNYTLTWRYANGKEDDRSGTVKVNDSTGETVEFITTNDWVNWKSTSPITVALKKGTNTITLQAETENGLANIDNLKLSGSGARISLGSCSDSGSDNDGSDSGSNSGGSDSGSDNDGSDSGSDNGGSDSGSDNSGSDNGSDNSGSDSGSNNGGSDNGGSDSGSDSGGSDSGSDNDGSDSGSDNGGSDSGSDNGGSDSGSDNGGSDSGSDNGGSDNGSDNSGSDNGSDNSGSDNGSDTSAIEFDTNVPMGWAVVPGYNRLTTTGGAGGEVVTATNASELSSYLKDDTPRIVLIKGTISASGHIDMGSNKTVLGLGDTAKIEGAYLNMNGESNVIIRNLEVTGGTDAIAARHTTHLWIDHVYVHNASDGLIDITRESDRYTVSWTEFYNHHKTMLLNGGSRHYDDRGKMNGTLHHNYFNQTKSRNPRAGFGMIHIFNDYNYKNGYGIGYHTESKVLAENNYFKDMKNSIKQMYKNADEQGDALSVGNVFDGASGDGGTGIGFEPTNYYLYDFMLDEGKDVPGIVLEGVGLSAEFSNIGLMPIPGQGTVGVTDSTLSWMTGTYSPASYVLYFGTTMNPPEIIKTTATSYDVESLESGKTYYWRVDQLTTDGTVEGKLWTFKAK